MHKLSKLATALLIGSALSASALASGTTFVKVNGVAVSQTLADVLIAAQKAQGAPDGAELKNAVRERLIQRELLIQAAKKAGTDKKPDVAVMAEAERQNFIINAYLQDYAKKNPISDDQLKAQYDALKAQLGATEYKARHILVSAEADAAAIIANLKKGAKFDELAKQSIDPGSKDNGGDLGWSSAGNFVKPFGDALAALGRGKYTETPVKTDFGYHVIMLEDTRPLAVPSFDELKPRLMQQAQSQQIGALIEGMRAKAKVE